MQSFQEFLPKITRWAMEHWVTQAGQIPLEEPPDGGGCRVQWPTRFGLAVMGNWIVEGWTASFRLPTVLVGGHRNAGAPAISHQGRGWLGTREAVDGFVDILLHLFTESVYYGSYVPSLSL